MSASAEQLRFGSWTAIATRGAPFGLVISGLAADGSAGETVPPADYLHDVLLAPDGRAQFFALVDREGLVVCLDVATAHPGYRDVRGRSSRGRLSQGEYYHHDGCSGPQKPRVVEIRFPHQAIERRIATAVAPFPDTVKAMLRCLPSSIASLPEIARGRADAESAEAVLDWDTLQGIVTRAVRRELSAESARAYFREVDSEAGAYRDPWRMGESRFIANANAHRTMQHRRAYLDPHVGLAPSGHLVKRWPAEEL